jgi:cytoskeletal protein CcmA (bactofilin family)
LPGAVQWANDPSARIAPETGVIALNYFAPSKNQRDVQSKDIEPRLNGGAGSPEILSTFGAGMTITGRIVCAGALQIFGRVNGEIQASHLVIGEGAMVEGKIIAEEAVIQGAFSGTIQGNSVKLQGKATVEGEIFNKSLVIEPNVQFEGVARRLDRSVEAPATDDLAGLAPAPVSVG